MADCNALPDGGYEDVCVRCAVKEQREREGGGDGA